jgi:ribosomal-protein-alanine N-acetyltransferase
MNLMKIDHGRTIVRPIEQADVRSLIRLVDTAWRVHLRIMPVELQAKIEIAPGYLAEDQGGVRGFIIIDPQPMKAALIVAASLRDSWNVKAYLDLLLPRIEQAAVERELNALIFIGNTPWLVNELEVRDFEIREWIVTFERIGTAPPSESLFGPAFIRTAHFSDLSVLSALDELAFDHIWHKSMSDFREALARADSFAVALIDNQIVAYEWCELYEQHAHLTRLAVHPDFQGRGIGAQLLHHAIIEALERGANLITLNTQEKNDRSQALYRRFGFVSTHERLPIMWKDLK